MELLSLIKSHGLFGDKIQNIKITCINGLESKFACFSKDCMNYSFVCQDDNCKCQKEHPKCMITKTSKVLKNLEDKVISLKPLQSQIQYTLNKVIDYLSDFKDKILSLLEQKCKYNGLNLYQQKFVQAISTGNLKGIVGNEIYKINNNYASNHDSQMFDKIPKLIKTPFQQIPQLLKSLQSDICKIIQCKIMQPQITSLQNIKIKTQDNLLKRSEFIYFLSSYEIKILNPNVLSKIGAISPGEQSLYLHAKIIKVERIKNKLKLILGDQSGIVTAFLPVLPILKQNNQILLLNSSAQVFRQRIQITCREGLIYEVYQCSKKIQKVFKEFDISEKQWVEA